MDDRLKLLAPDTFLIELQKHLKVNASFRRRMSISSHELDELLFLLTSQIEIVSKDEYKAFLPEALKTVPHKEDAPFLALALYLHIPIWSNDKGFRIQDKIKIYSTTELNHVLS